MTLDSNIHVFYKVIFKTKNRYLSKKPTKMSEVNPAKTKSDRKSSNTLLHSDTLTKVLGADAMQILRCGICMDFFEVPIVLPCGHTFCLHCLTQMCKHASLTHAPNSTQDVRIGCPNCRVLIYATPILRRNVTCNFIVQSLIECLRAREDRSPTCQGVSNTTNDQNSTTPRTQPVAGDVHNDGEMLRVLNDFDGIIKTLARSNIVDNSFLEIEEIRRGHLTRERQRQAERDARTRDQVRFVKNIMKQSREDQNIQQIQQQQQQQLLHLQQQQQQRHILPRPQQLNQNQSRPENPLESTLSLGKSPFHAPSQSEPLEQQLQNNNIIHQHHQQEQSQKHAQLSAFHHHRQTQNQHLDLLLQHQQHHEQHHQQQQQLQQQQQQQLLQQQQQRLTTPNPQSTNRAFQSVPCLNNPSASVNKVTSMTTPTPLPVDTLPDPMSNPGGILSIPSGQNDIPKITPADCVHLNNDPAVMSYSLVTNNTPSSGQARTVDESTSTITKSSGSQEPFQTSRPSDGIAYTPPIGLLGSLVTCEPSSGHSMSSLVTSKSSGGHTHLITNTSSTNLSGNLVTKAPYSGLTVTTALVSSASSGGQLRKPS